MQTSEMQIQRPGILGIVSFAVRLFLTMAVIFFAGLEINDLELEVQNRPI